MRNYRNAFAFALVGNLVLIGILAGFWWRSTQYRKAEAAQPASTSTSANSPNESGSAEVVQTETALVPVQLSPERLQSIGVRTGRAERKVVSDEIRVTGSVAVDETRLAYVQVRYTGYIQ